MEEDKILLHKGISILIYDLNDNNDDFYILQTQSMIRAWYENNFHQLLSSGAKSQVQINIRNGKHVNEDIDERIKDENDILIVFGGTELINKHISSVKCDQLIEKRINGIEFIIYNSIKSNPDLILDKFVCGFCNKTLVLTLPLITKYSLDILNQIQKILKHALDVYHNDLPAVRKNHGEKLNVSPPPKSNILLQQKSRVNLDVTKRERKSTYPMVEVETAQKIVLDFIDANKCKGENQKINLKKALGYIVAEKVVAKDDLPPFDASIKDGYAVIASDAAGKRKVVGERSAGSSKVSSPLKSHQCVRINTGAPIPLGADSVVQVEDTELKKASNGEEVEINILKTPIKGQDIRFRGADIKKGTIVLEEGNLIGPAELGLLASVGVTEISVFRKPTVHIFSTGNELEDPDSQQLKQGCIRDSNKTVLCAILKENGFNCVDKGICKDDPNTLLIALQLSLSEADVIITTGSVSMGDKDYLKEILKIDLNAKIHFGRINMKPGKPTTFATVNNNKLIFCLPGNPVSAMVTCHLFVIVALKYLSGYHHPYPNKMKCKVTNDITMCDERPEYHRVVLQYDHTESHLIAHSTGHQLSSRLLSCKSCDGFALVPKADSKLKIISKNSLVDVILTKRIF